MIYDCGLGGPQVQQIAAGSHHSLVLTNDGGVIAWGSNLEGQLGLHGVSGLINTPTKVNIPEPVKQISAGYYHSAFLTENGLVYVCGEAESGKLGIVLDFRTQLAPKQMSLSVKVVHVACGGHHTLLLGEDGNIYCTGSNASGQLGMGSTITEIQTPKQLERGALQDETITKLVCGESHIAVVTGSGKLFTCGDGRHGKLGLEENENNVHELTYAIKYQELFVTNVACGGCHTILVGRRRETENDDEETKQMKISPLPPLKVPVSRIQNDSPVAKPENPNIANNQENENGTEEIVSDTVEDTKSLSNSIEKPESPKKPADYSESEEMKVKEDEMSNEKSQNDDENDKKDDNEDKIESNNDNESESDNKIENGEDLKPEETENHNGEDLKPKETENHNGDDENQKKEERPKSSVSRVSQVDKPNEENEIETKTNDENSNEPMNEEKSESPPLPVPPPKPPRQKTGSAGSVSPKSDNHSASRSGSAEVSMPNAGIKPEAPLLDEEMEKNDDEKKSEIGSDKKSAGSEKSQSNKSKAVSEETAPLEAVENSIEQLEHMGDKAIEAVAVIEGKIDMAADDADVVHSPAPRAGKISKLFHLKKSEVENGNKLSSLNVKAKSKTCSIL